MEFVPYRLLRNQPGELRKKLEEKGELIVTVDGEPMALMLQVPKGSLEDLVLLVSQVRATTGRGYDPPASTPTRAGNHDNRRCG